VLHAPHGGVAGVRTVDDKSRKGLLLRGADKSLINFRPRDPGREFVREGRLPINYGATSASWCRSTSARRAPANGKVLHTQGGRNGKRLDADRVGPQRMTARRGRDSSDVSSDRDGNHSRGSTLPHSGAVRTQVPVPVKSRRAASAPLDRPGRRGVTKGGASARVARSIFHFGRARSPSSSEGTSRAPRACRYVYVAPA